MVKEKIKKIDMDDGKSPLRISMGRFMKNKTAVFGLVVLTILIVLSLLAPVLTPYDRDAVDIFNTFQPPSREHLLGTDDVGRDTFTRLLYGGQVSLSVGLVSAGIAILFGVTLGVSAGYFGGWVDMCVMRLVDIFMSMPFYVITITLAAIFGPSIWNVMIMTGCLAWTNIARIVRAQTLSLREIEFVEAARALGLNAREIMFRHIVPNTLGLIIVYATLGIASGILSEAGLSYLGLGVKQPQPSWGNMLASAQSLRVLTNYWWLWVPPGIAVFVTVLSINLVGDGLRDALDPKMSRR